MFCRVHVQNHTRGVYPGYYPTKNLWKFCVGRSYPYPELLEVLYGTHTRTRDFCKFCTPIATIPGVRVCLSMVAPTTFL